MSISLTDILTWSNWGLPEDIVNAGNEEAISCCDKKYVSLMLKTFRIIGSADESLQDMSLPFIL
jgi:hypothetical protein